MDELLKEADPKKIFSADGLMAKSKKAPAERMLDAEMERHLRSESAPTAEGAAAPANHRNG